MRQLVKRNVRNTRLINLRFESSMFKNGLRMYQNKVLFLNAICYSLYNLWSNLMRSTTFTYGLNGGLFCIIGYILVTVCYTYCSTLASYSRVEVIFICYNLNVKVSVRRDKRALDVARSIAHHSKQLPVQVFEPSVGN